MHTIRLGLIADTYDLLRLEARVALAGVERTFTPAASATRKCSTSWGGLRRRGGARQQQSRL